MKGTAIVLIVLMAGCLLALCLVATKQRKDVQTLHQDVQTLHQAVKTLEQVCARYHRALTGEPHPFYDE